MYLVVCWGSVPIPNKWPPGSGMGNNIWSSERAMRRDGAHWVQQGHKTRYDNNIMWIMLLSCACMVMNNSHRECGIYEAGKCGQCPLKEIRYAWVLLTTWEWGILRIALTERMWLCGAHWERIIKKAHWEQRIENAAARWQRGDMMDVCWKQRDTVHCVKVRKHVLTERVSLVKWCSLRASYEDSSLKVRN